MDAARVLVLIRRWWWLLATGVIVGVAAFGVSSRIRDGAAPPVFAAAAVLDVHLGAEDGSLREQWELDRLIATYAEAARSDRVAAQVRDELGLHNSVEDVRARMRAEPVAETSLLRLEARGSSASDAEALRNALVRAVNRLPAEDALTGSTSLYETTPAGRIAGDRTPEMLTALLVAVAGLLAACGVIFAFEHLGDAVHDARDIEKLTSLAVAGRIPHFPASRGPGGHAADEFRALRTELSRIEAASRAHVLLVAGARPGDGASTVAANYAGALAATGRRVALVDGDLRDGRLDAHMQAHSHVTLAQILGEDIIIDAAISETRLPGVALIAAGRSERHPADLLESERARRLFTVLREAFDVVVVDAPPALLSADALALAAHADATIVVARQGRTARRELCEVLRRFRRMPARPVAIVLNDDLAVRSPRPVAGHLREPHADAEAA
jgi:receptor protein-tyrosine kinase